ncbi:hypothetical protein [Pelotalea chapellei]|uniref:Uncharacterized protein n=1 Tax=Pelotalea chapellei TaxID=44671 RepID=A0ABS5UA11_9BACT|nr:hypothetical protein [Pelotalea chapellei]MBT1072473.1 hypothetical protein [Pelotalea chapellei]
MAGPLESSGTPGGYSPAATWQAIKRIPMDHFPLILPRVHSIAAFFILRQLKHNGFSNCRVTTTKKGLIVHAHR